MLQLVFVPGPSLGGPFDDPISKQGNPSRDHDRANGHGGVSIPTFLQNGPQPCLMQRQRMLHRENQFSQPMLSRADQRQGWGLEDRRRCSADRGDHIPLQQPCHHGCHDDGGWIQRKEMARMPMEKPNAIWSGRALRCDSFCQNARARCFRVWP